MILNKELLASFVLAWILGYHQPIQAQNKALDSNYREGCRLRIAGLFLDIYSQSENAKNAVSLLEENNRKLKEKAEDLRRELATTEKKISSDYYSVPLLETKADLEAQLSRIQGAIEENTKSLKISNASLPKLGSEADELRDRIMHLFFFQRLDGGGLGYHFQIQYRSKCPAYDDSCALSRAGIEDLRKIFQGYPFPEVCTKYITQSQSQP